MQVYLSAIAGHVPDKMVQAIAAFLDFCYFVRRPVIDQQTIHKIEDALNRFHTHRTIFKTTGVRTSFSLPRQHSLKHYIWAIQQFGAPNGLCTSITESRHITAVKEPWRRSNRFEALGQMLKINQRLHKLSAARADFEERGMLKGNILSTIMDALLQAQGGSDQENSDAENCNSESVEVATGLEVEGEFTLPAGEQQMQASLPPEDDGTPVDGKRVVGFVNMAVTPRMSVSLLLPLSCKLIISHAILPERGYPRTLLGLGQYIKCPSLMDHVRRFLYYQAHPESDRSDIELEECPTLPDSQRVLVFHSACATFYSPSDISGLGGMKSEHIRSCPRWRGKEERRDCAFAQKDDSIPGIKGLHVVRILMFFSFKVNGRRGTVYPCALVEWFSLVGDERDPVTGMWVVQPDLDSDGKREVSVIHLDTLVRSAHVLAVFGDRFLPTDFHFSYTLNAFRAYYVNQYADHHMNELIMV